MNEKKKIIFTLQVSLVSKLTISNSSSPCPIKLDSALTLLAPSETYIRDVNGTKQVRFTF